MMLTVKTKGMGEKLVPVQLHTAQIPHVLPWEQTWAFLVRNWLLTACAMAQHFGV
jgi:hypothetical protein